MCGALPPGRWGELNPRWPETLPRKPGELRFLDLVQPGAVVEQRALGDEEVRAVQTEHFAITLRLDRADWPKPKRDAAAAGGSSLLSRFAVKTLPDPRPHGEVLAEIWVDQEGRLRRFSWTERGGRAASAKAVWLTTELWDFGGPPPIADHLSQPVIDPTTFEPVKIGPPSVSEDRDGLTGD
jgi:hypothetical protein